MNMLIKITAIIFAFFNQAISQQALLGYDEKTRQYFGSNQQSKSQLLLAHINDAPIKEYIRIILDTHTNFPLAQQLMSYSQEMPKTLEEALNALPWQENEIKKIKLKLDVSNVMIEYLSSKIDPTYRILVFQYHFYSVFYNWQLECLNCLDKRQYYVSLTKTDLNPQKVSKNYQIETILSLAAFAKIQQDINDQKKHLATCAMLLAQAFFGIDYSKKIAQIIQNVLLALQPNGRRQDFNSRMKKTTILNFDSIINIPLSENNFKDYGLFAFVIGAYIKILDPENQFTYHSAAAIDNAPLFWSLYPIHKRVIWDATEITSATLAPELINQILANPLEYLLIEICKIITNEISADQALKNNANKLLK